MNDKIIGTEHEKELIKGIEGTLLMNIKYLNKPTEVVAKHVLTYVLEYIDEFIYEEKSNE